MNREILKEHAKQRLRENRWPMVLMAFITSAVSAVSSLFSNVKIDEQGSNQTVLLALGAISFIVTAFLVNIVAIGACKFFRDNIRSNQEIEVVTYPFQNDYAKNVGTMLIKSLLELVGVILFIIPGFVVAMGLAAVPYLLTQKPELGAMDTIKYSWGVMKGHKWEYFVLILSFFGWMCLDILTLGILGIFYVHPYLMQTKAEYFDRLLAEETAGTLQEQ